LRRSYDCDTQAVRIAAKAHASIEAWEIVTLASQASPENLEIPSKRPSILVSPKEADVMKIDLGTGDPSKITIISAHLSKK
jgi:hypothetical protein